MKKEFETIYQELLEEEEIKKQWNKYQEGKRKLNIIILLVIILFDAVILWTTKEFTSTIITLLLIWNFIVFIMANIFYSKNQKKYNHTFKEIVIKKLLDNFYDDVQYYPAAKMPYDTYNEGDYNEQYNKYYSDDLFKAKIDDKSNIECAEIKTQIEKKYIDNQGRVQKEVITIFNGLFAKIDINKSINTILKIRTNWIGLNRAKDKLEMDSQEFEKHFDVYTQNNIIAMQLLTSDIMMKLVDFKNNMKLKYDIGIFNNKIYIRFMTGPMFEAKISNKEILDKKSIEKYYKILQFTSELAEKLIEVIEETEI
ncbi:MAG: DUF3137 domain-containing protein [Clostridia bacterium]|nr:DUF3137 domain-containing protein [Clostridia bacterium]